MRARTTISSVAAALALAALIAPACLDLDEYTLVPGSPPNTGGFGSGGTGGDGGVPEECSASQSEGTLFATAIASASPSGVGEEPCTSPVALEAGIDLFAIEARDGACVASARIQQHSGASITSAARVAHAAGDVAVVGGTFVGGDIELPEQCAGGSQVLVSEEPAATDTLFIAALRRLGSGFCTDWIQTVWTDDPAGAGTLAIHSLAATTSGVAVAGSLGGAVAHFDGDDVQGGAFFARFSLSGALSDVVATGSSADDGAMALGASDLGWLVSGTLEDEDPSCHGCVGIDHVVGGVAACDVGAGGVGGGGAGGGGAGGAGGDAGGAGDGGMGGAPDDAQNAFVFHRQNADGTCVRLDTYGSDESGAADAQIGYGISARTSGASCRTYWTGLAGRSGWRLDVSDPTTALFDLGGASVDGFVTRLDGASASGCGSGAGHAWNVRLAPTPVDAVVWGNRVDANRCSDGAVLTAFVDGAGQTTLELHHCDAAGVCDANAAELPLAAGAARQLVVIELSAEGSVEWYSAFGPVAPGASTTALGAPVGASIDNLARSPNDNLTILVETTDEMMLHNLELFGCEQSFAAGAPAGTYLIHLEGGGFIDKGQCVWVRRLDR